MIQLFRYLTMNRAGTRIGRATWVYLGLYVVFLVANDIPVHKMQVLTLSTTEHFFMWFALLSPLILLLNRFDRSGPTLEEAREAAKSSKTEKFIASVTERILKKIFGNKRV